MTAHKPTYVMVSDAIRRDLVAPLREAQRLQLLMFYREASYGDMHPDEFGATLRPYRGPLNLGWQLWRARPNIIQAPDPFAIRLLPRLFVVFLVALLRRVPLVVVSFENRPLDAKYSPLLAWLLRWLLRPVVGYASLVIYLNNGVYRNMRALGVHERKLHRLLYGTWGVDTSEWTPRPDGREPALGPGPVVLFVGRLHAEKGLDDLLAAWELVCQQHPDAQLVLIGDGPARPALERAIATRGWAAQVRVLGTIKNRDLPPYFRAADLFVAPSRTTRRWEEQVGMTNIQAMACGLPVVSTRSGAIPEFVPHGVAGLLVPEQNGRALAGALAALLASPPLRERFGQAGRALTLERYDARRNVLLAEDVIVELR